MQTMIRTICCALAATFALLTLPTLAQTLPTRPPTAPAPIGLEDKGEFEEERDALLYEAERATLLKEIEALKAESQAERDLLKEIEKLKTENQRLKMEAARERTRYIRLYDDREPDKVIWTSCQPGISRNAQGGETRLLACRRKDGSVALLTERKYWR